LIKKLFYNPRQRKNGGEAKTMALVRTYEDLRF
jgi:hypothetical protein